MAQRLRLEAQVLEKAVPRAVLDDGHVLVRQIFSEDLTVPFRGRKQQIKFAAKRDLLALPEFPLQRQATFSAKDCACFQPCGATRS
jgi:hypothetical protein